MGQVGQDRDVVGDPEDAVRARPCEVVSTTAAASPASAIARSARCSAGRLGVVACAALASRTPRSGSRPCRSCPVEMPAASSAADREERGRGLAVRAGDPDDAEAMLGSPYHQAAAAARAARTSVDDELGQRGRPGSGGRRARPRRRRARRRDEVVAVDVQTGHRHEQGSLAEPSASRRSRRGSRRRPAPAAPIARPSRRAPRSRPSAASRSIARRAARARPARPPPGARRWCRLGHRRHRARASAAQRSRPSR